jgi:nitrate reductase NapE component
MGRRSTSQWVYPVASCSVRHGPLPSCDAECEPARGFGRGETLVLVLLLSFGLWALIWAGVSVLGAYGLR